MKTALKIYNKKFSSFFRKNKKVFLKFINRCNIDFDWMALLYKGSKTHGLLVEKSCTIYTCVMVLQSMP